MAKKKEETAEAAVAARRDALVILSGGQDSTTCLYWAKENFDKVHAITFDYGQRHRSEIEAATKIASLAQIESHEIVVLPEGILKGSSPLTDPTAELEQYTDAAQMDEVIGDRRELTFVPMRNALFLMLAANRAELLNANLVIGVCQMDNANYDDCRENFIDAAEAAINLALGHDHRGTAPILVHAPLMHHSKASSIKMAMELSGCYAALAYTMTSYDGNFPPTDNNHANVLRAAGFEEAGVPDPLVVRAWQNGLMPLPVTSNYSPAAFKAAGFGDVL